MKTHISCDHIAVFTHRQSKGDLLELCIQQIAARHPAEVAACKRVCLQCQFIKVGAAVQLREKALSCAFIIEQNLLDVYLLGGTGKSRNDFVTHPCRFCPTLQSGPKSLL